MAENENMVVEDMTPPEEQKEKKITWAKFKAGLKEWCRKQIVNLKRRPSNIALLILLITSLVFLIGYSSVARYLMDERTNSGVVQWSGLCSFVTFLFSILVFLLFMNAFPKRKKVNIVMLVLTYLFLAVMIFTNVVCYVEMNNVISASTATYPTYYYSAQRLFVAHIVLLAITIVFISITPLLKMGLMKINTRKDLGSSEFKGELDLENVEE